MSLAIAPQEMLRRYHYEANAIKAEQGLILIPDVSGFTNFVSSICIEAGRYIVRELLTTIIESNSLGLKISEVEGDAVLFYKFCSPPTAELIIQQYEVMLRNFREKLFAIEALTNRKMDLSLKLIAHYGPFTEYAVGGFSKLYGNTVVQSHNLLKNTIESNTYLLLTADLLKFEGRKRSFNLDSNYMYIDYQNRNLA